MLFPTLDSRSWSRYQAGEGTKGPRIAEVHLRRVRAQRQGQAGPEVWLLVRLDPESGEQKAFLSNAPATLSSTRLVTLSGLRWPVEQILGSVQHRNRKRNNRYRVRRLRVLALKSALSLA